MNKFKKNKGITLVALIITIIILLILAVVSIQAVKGDGIISHAKNARSEYSKAQENEKEILEKYLDIIPEALATEEKEYKINYNLIECSSDVNNPEKIKENEEITLTFHYNGNSEFSYVTCEGAEFSVSDGGTDCTVQIKNPVSDVTITVAFDGCCFVAGTPVWMEDGTTKNIEDVRVGDIVLSYNEESEEYENCKVIGLITNINTTNLARVTLKDGTMIEMNEYHPIYTQEGWKSLTNYEGLPTLTENDKVLSTNGEYIDILTIEQWKEDVAITTYNLSIENNHNYFVGETPLLVHNAGCSTE